MKVQQTPAMTLTADSLAFWSTNLAKVLAGNVSFGTTTGNNEQDRNVNCWKASGATPGTANTEFSVSHELGRIPIGWILLSCDQAGVLYKSTTAWTDTTIYLKCSVASMNYLIAVV